MKYSVLCLLLVSMAASAGDYYDPRIDTYDPSTGLYYKAVSESVEGGGVLSSKAARNLVVNINVFDPATGSSSLLFNEPQKDGISVVLFETGFKDGSVEFTGTSYPSVVLNNSRLATREPKNKLLVGVKNAGAKETTLFTADKRGTGLKKLASVPSSADWHIDVKNSKLRIVHQTGTGVRIDSYEW